MLIGSKYADVGDIERVPVAGQSSESHSAGAEDAILRTGDDSPRTVRAELDDLVVCVGRGVEVACHVEGEIIAHDVGEAYLRRIRAPIRFNRDLRDDLLHRIGNPHRIFIDLDPVGSEGGESEASGRGDELAGYGFKQRAVEPDRSMGTTVRSHR